MIRISPKQRATMARIMDEASASSAPGALIVHPPDASGYYDVEIGPIELRSDGRTWWWHTGLSYASAASIDDAVRRWKTHRRGSPQDQLMRVLLPLRANRRNTRLTPAMKKQVRLLHRSGLNDMAIARAMSIKPSTVKYARLLMKLRGWPGNCSLQ